MCTAPEWQKPRQILAELKRSLPKLQQKEELTMDSYHKPTSKYKQQLEEAILKRYENIMS